MGNCSESTSSSQAPPPRIGHRGIEQGSACLTSPALRTWRAVRSGAPVLVADLNDPAETRWPAFTEAALEAGVSAVFALPVSLASPGWGR